MPIHPDLEYDSDSWGGYWRVREGSDLARQLGIPPLEDRTNHIRICPEPGSIAAYFEASAERLQAKMLSTLAKENPFAALMAEGNFTLAPEDPPPYTP